MEEREKEASVNARKPAGAARWHGPQSVRTAHRTLARSLERLKDREVPVPIELVPEPAAKTGAGTSEGA